MKNALTTIIKALVSDENAVSVKETENEKSVTFQVKVAEVDMGKVIGREGRIAKSIRTIMQSLAAKENKKVIVEFMD